jgi:hypothetical protein
MGRGEDVTRRRHSMTRLGNGIDRLSARLCRPPVFHHLMCGASPCPTILIAYLIRGNLATAPCSSQASWTPRPPMRPRVCIGVQSSRFSVARRIATVTACFLTNVDTGSIESFARASTSTISIICPRKIDSPATTLYRYETIHRRVHHRPWALARSRSSWEGSSVLSRSSGA